LVVKRPGWRLTTEAFALLLGALDADAERAAEKYESLRHRLIVYFDVRRAVAAEDMADEVLDRVCRRLEEGEPIRAVAPYAYGVASHVLREGWRFERRRLPVLLAGDDDDEKERRDRCLALCLDQLAPDLRDLVLRYHTGQGRIRSADRERLAAERGTSLSGLRTKMHRLREQLQRQMERCVNARRA
jgi:DNA-directed RNA polymerase specialized sigma24 family protein